MNQAVHSPGAPLASRISHLAPRTSHLRVTLSPFAVHSIAATHEPRTCPHARTPSTRRNRRRAAGSLSRRRKLRGRDRGGAAVPHGAPGGRADARALPRRARRGGGSV